MSDLELVFLNRCVTDAAYLSKAAAQLNGYRFDGPERNWIWRVAKECVEDHGEAPGFRLLTERVQREFKTDDEVLAAVRVIREIKAAREGSPQSTLDEMTRKYRLQRGSAVAERLVDALERKDADALTEAIREGDGEIRQRGAREGDAGLLEIAKSLLNAGPTEQLSDFVPTGFAYIDRRWKGIKVGEEYLTAGVTNVGKSISMIQTGAKSVARAIPAIHVTTEMDKPAVASRYISRFTGIPEENIREHTMSRPERELFERWMNANWDRMNNLLRIERIAPNAGTMADIRALVKERSLSGRPPRLLIIDSPDHLRSQRRYNDKRHESTDIHFDIMALAGDFNIAVAATTQLEKSWAGKVAPPEAVAEDYNKSRTAAWFTSINELKDDKGNSRLYLFIGKRRAGKKGQLIPLLCDLERMRMDSAPEDDAP